MNQPAPSRAPSGDKTPVQPAARRNYLVFCGVSGVFLFGIVLVGSLLAFD
jgi:hypothetical protein